MIRFLLRRLLRPHLSIFPGAAIAVLVLGFNFLGDGLRDAMDPKRLLERQ